MERWRGCVTNRDDVAKTDREPMVAPSKDTLSEQPDSEQPESLPLSLSCY